MAVWKRIVRNYFTFNKRERRGVVSLMVLLILLASVHLLIKVWPTSNQELSEKEIRILNSISFKSQENTELGGEASDTTIDLEMEWEPFNPNLVSVDQLISFGLDSAIASRIENYRKKGGRFIKPKDVSRIYGMDTSWFSQAEPYMVFPELSFEKQSMRILYLDSSERKTYPIVKLELNLADSAQLISLPFIGPYFAKQIVKMRNSLGGYMNYGQLLEIYHMNDQAYESLQKHTSLDTSLVEKIDINHCEADILGRHPYISWKQAKVIINYRQNHGSYKLKSELKNTKVIMDSVYAKIAPYLIIK